MYECIKRLISQGDEESLECLCQLLKTKGKELDDPTVEGSKESMEGYFTQMQKIVDKRLTSSRIRFMLQDVIDLKRNDWFPRRNVNNPKTIDQIHKDAECEAPGQQQNLQNMSFQKKENEELRRSVQGILNKLTPQMFETLLTQIKNLNIDTEEKLSTVIDLIFEEAVAEPNSSVPYANMCKHLALIKVPTKNKDYVNFRKVLLTKCQKEFEEGRGDELKYEERVKALEEAAPEENKELEQEMYDEDKTMRYRQLGNTRFIGELFRLGMLTEPIMHECIKRLISQGDEVSLECLCQLLKTIGKELDDRRVKGLRERMMENCFLQIQKIVDKRLTSSRVRFMLQDVIDLKREF